MNKWHAIGYGILGAFILDALGRPTAAKAVLPVIGRAPTIATGDATKPGLLEGLFSGGLFGGGQTV